MARVSFTVRKTSGASAGSHLRYERPVDQDYDSALRADGLQIAPNEFTDAFFQATAVCYGEVFLEWGIDLVDTVTAQPQPYQVVLVYSPHGVPQTIAGGEILLESNLDTSFFHDTGLVPGRWAYYGMFVRYLSTGGDDYYERVAALNVLCPRNYGSTELLWNRIPHFYQELDNAQGTSDYSPCVGTTRDKVGPLYKFLSIIGFDMDRIRTMVDYIMVSKDPQEANSETLDALASTVGLPIQTQDMGDLRLRTLLDDIGVIRRSKGTLEGTELYAKALTGCDIEINQSTDTVKIYSQRVNHVTDPLDATGLVTWRAAQSTDFAVPQPFVNSASAFNGQVTVSGTTYSLNSTANDVKGAVLRLSSPIYVKSGDRAIFSAHSPGGDRLKWARLMRVSDNLELGLSMEPIAANGVTYVEVPTPNLDVINHVYLPGTSGTYVRTDDHPDLDITGDITLVAEIAPDLWDGASGAQTIIAKRSGNASEISYQFRLETSGALSFVYATGGGTTPVSRTSTSNLSAFVDGAWKWVACTVDVTDGANHVVRFWTGDDGVSWTPLGSAVTTAGNITLHSGTAFVEVGSRNTGTSELFKGKIRRARVYNGIGASGTVGGTLVGEYVANGKGSFSDITGKQWSVFASVSPHRTEPVTSGFTSAILEFGIDLTGGTLFNTANLLLERNHIGSYFDGSTKRGGWLIDSGSISDYRWAGSAYNSRSLYTEDYQRMKYIVDALFDKVLPINVDYTISAYNAVPGV